MHRRYAIWSTQKLRFLYPEVTAVLYETDGWFVVHVSGNVGSPFPELERIFDNEVRPAASPIRLSQTTPPSGIPVEEEVSYEAELWLNGVPLSSPLLNKLLGVAAPNVPNGSLDYAREEDVWVFRSLQELSGTERATVEGATSKLGFNGPVRFLTVKPENPAPNFVAKNPPLESLDLVTARELRRSASPLQQLVECDEDEWRKFLDDRTKQKLVFDPAFHDGKFACLYDVADRSDIRLSELLTLYDRIDLLPSREDLAWLEKHKLGLGDLQELVRMKRVRLILPHSAEKYPEQLLRAVSEVDSASLMLSRALASKTIQHGQFKEPLLYAPLTAKQRSSVLSALSQVITDKAFRALLGSYSRLFQGQHDVFMMRGAMASFGFGVGAYLGEVFYQLNGQEARLELMTCGAAIEWAMGLGASFIPRNFGLYDETSNSEIVASYLGRTGIPQLDPATDRMHVVVDGLLAVSDVPPLEVARNFRSLPALRFRNVARKLMSATPNAADLEKAVEEINQDVAAFERRAERLARWKLEAVIEETVYVGIGERLGPFASIVAAWLYRMLKDKVPPSIKRELADTGQMLLGLATGTCIDAVIVSRSRKALGGD